MLLIAGLGNPGPRYAGNRHNVGFMAVDDIARDPAFSAFSRKFSGEIADGIVAGEKVVLLKPLTFMNESGRSVSEAARFYKLEPGNIVVIHDELDLAPARLRVKTGGGNGGHNGLRSIDAHLGSKDYRRVRLGIGHPGTKEAVTPHVLSDFHNVDGEWLEPLLEAVARNLPSLIAGDDVSFMNRVALATASGEPEGAHGRAAPKPHAGKAPGQSHIRQAQTRRPDQPTVGPLAAMLKTLFGAKD